MDNRPTTSYAQEVMGRNNQAKRRAKKRKKKRLPIASAAASPAVRPCDGCTACCSVFGVAEIAKTPWTACEHLNEVGCSIYAERPKMCHEFYCLWQNGLGPDAARPDKLGVIFAPTNGVFEATGEKETQAYEIEPGAFNKPAVIMVAQMLTAKGMLVIGHTHGGRSFRFSGPAWKIQRAQEWVANKRGDVQAEIQR